MKFESGREVEVTISPDGVEGVSGDWRNLDWPEIREAVQEIWSHGYRGGSQFGALRGGK
jgi:hypothetical protein